MEYSACAEKNDCHGGYNLISEKRRHEVDDGESDTTECEWRVTQPRSPPRRSRGKRGKQRGHVSGKRQLSQQTYSR